MALPVIECECVDVESVGARDESGRRGVSAAAQEHDPLWRRHDQSLSRAVARSARIPAMATGAVDRIRITTVVDNYIDNLRQDSAVARRYSAFVAGKMPDLRAEHGLAHFVETTRGDERLTMALGFGLAAAML